MLNEQDMQWIHETVEKIIKKMDWVSDKSKNKIPSTTVNGEHDDRSALGLSDNLDAGLACWTNGFWGGIMWQMYHETGNKKYADIARYSEELLDTCFEQFYGLHHDLGFMWLPTAVADYRETGNADARRRGLHAANLLAGRFNPAGRFIRAWNKMHNEEVIGWAIIDCMMNLNLLYWASEETKDPRFRQIAMMHADTAMANFIRPDGSSNHIVEFDPETGEKVRTYGGQGYENGSSWTRGQAWALYGFVLSYIHTGKQDYLDTAKRVAHYFMANILDNGLIPVDFRQPATPYWEDSTAAAIAACGLIEIAAYGGEYEQALYQNAALKMLKALEKERCCWGKECDCILQKCSSAYHDQRHEFNLIYGDYYFIEAIFKLKGDGLFLW